jgi:Putative prokaryotic signal transducing protein
MPLVEAARFYNSFEAGLAESKLADAGIHSVLFDVEMANYGIGVAIPIRLMVLDEDLGDALKELA